MSTPRSETDPDPDEISYPDFCTELEQRSVLLYDESDYLINLKLAGTVQDRQLYVDTLADFYFVFCALEEEIRKRRNHECIRRLLPAEVLRKEAFEQDLKYYLGCRWHDKIRPSAAAQCYCDRIVRMSERNPPMLLAYVHSLHLGLLSGGANVRMTIQKLLALPDDTGVAIFTFKEMRRPVLRRHIKEHINELNLSRHTKDRIVDEKLLCSKLNNAVISNVRPVWRSDTRMFAGATLVVAVLLLIVYAVRRGYALRTRQT